MLKILLGLFLILHGVVHLLYVGQSAGFYELQPGLSWPNGSWIFDRLLGDNITRTVTTVSLILAAIAFAVAGLGLFVGWSWWQPLLIFAAILSTIIYTLMWDGSLQRLDDKGAVGLLLNLIILLGLLIFYGTPIELLT